VRLDSGSASPDDGSVRLDSGSASTDDGSARLDIWIRVALENFLRGARALQHVRGARALQHVRGARALQHVNVWGARALERVHLKVGLVEVVGGSDGLTTPPKLSPD
jgi:hypothetical protein